MIIELIQSVLLSTYFVVLCFQLAVVNGHNTLVTPSGKVTRPTGLNKGTEGKQMLGTRNLSSGAASKRANRAPTKTITFSSSKPVMPSKVQLSISKAVVKKKDSTANATKSSLGRWPDSGARNVRGHRKRRTNFARSRRRRTTNTHKGWLATRNGVSNNGTAINDSNFQGNNATAGNQTNQHPCNSNQTPSMEYKVGKIECRRWQSTELQEEMNCRGMYNHQYLASSFKEALKFKDLDTGRHLYLSRSSFILNRKPSRRQKKNVRINPGETLIVQCHGEKTPTPSGHLRICPVCMAITRQPSKPRRFPEYINELLCDPQMVSNYLPGIDAFCVQKTFTLDLLQFAGDWELNAAFKRRGRARCLHREMATIHSNDTTPLRMRVVTFKPYANTFVAFLLPNFSLQAVWKRIGSLVIVVFPLLGILSIFPSPTFYGARKTNLKTCSLPHSRE